MKLFQSHFSIRFGALTALMVGAAGLGLAQVTSATQVHDASVLKPPVGSRVAIVEFEDMECPVCGNINPLLRQAVTKYNLPLVRHDFPLRYHAWSMQAAVNARWSIRSRRRLAMSIGMLCSPTSLQLLRWMC